jgi:hypothetical protein
MRAMAADHLPELDAAVRRLLSLAEVQGEIRRLKARLPGSEEPFVWAVLDLGALGCDVPAAIRSGWIFVLKAGSPSGCHYHPNSVQHMVMVEGRGTSRVGGATRAMACLGAPGQALEQTWYAIGEGVHHEFFPEQRDMVVLSFHTCAAEELLEIDCRSGDSRRYEG